MRVLPVVLLVAAAAQHREARACSGDGGPLLRGYPAAEETDVPRDTMVRCRERCPDGTWLFDQAGHSVPGTWSTIAQFGPYPFPHRIFKPSVLLAAHTRYTLRDVDFVAMRSFTTGDVIMGERPDPPVPTFLPWEATCYDETSSCGSLSGTDWLTTEVTLDLDDARADLLYVEIDCSAELTDGGRGGFLDHATEDPDWLFLGNSFLSFARLQSSPGDVHFVRFASLGRNGRLSAWSETLKVAIPTSCGEDLPPMGFEIVLAGADTPLGCTSTAEPMDDGPPPEEPVEDDEDSDGRSDEEPDENDGRSGGAPRDAREGGCSASGGGDAVGLFVALIGLVRWRRAHHS